MVAVALFATLDRLFQCIYLNHGQQKRVREMRARRKKTRRETYQNLMIPNSATQNSLIQTDIVFDV